MSVLICDSNGELWHTRAKELGLDYISMPYFVDGEEYYYDLGEKTDFRKFYDLVRGGKIPTTQALNPEDYKRILTPYFEKGEDVLYVSFSHKLSGTFQFLNLALNELKETYPDRKCTVFDTNSISLGAGIQMEEAAKLKQSGASDEEILAFLKDFTNRVCVYFVVDDLMHLKRGGRCSGLAAFAGTLLQLKPLLSMGADGGLTVLGKISGRKKAATDWSCQACRKVSWNLCCILRRNRRRNRRQTESRVLCFGCCRSVSVLLSERLQFFWCFSG